ncbi:hypothetical protein WJX72_011283 [[Myrmecia] bisecta]|uniref:Essential protein Yae1 N-terminal domain-containing protein n=1 Tax=[Myrmecia] bisecta TaxID=41462 RepID=A0AAW1PZF2_9CHLO
MLPACLKLCIDTFESVYVCHHDDDERRKQELDREWNSRREQFWNSGYRDGLDAGKEATIQQGFDAGFWEGANAGYEWGLVHGAVMSLRIFSGQVAGTSGLAEQVKQLSERVGDFEPRALQSASDSILQAGRGAGHDAEAMPSEFARLSTGDTGTTDAGAIAGSTQAQPLRQVADEWGQPRQQSVISENTVGFHAFLHAAHQDLALYGCPIVGKSVQPTMGTG